MAQWPVLCTLSPALLSMSKWCRARGSQERLTSMTPREGMSCEVRTQCPSANWGATQGPGWSTKDMWVCMCMLQCHGHWAQLSQAQFNAKLCTWHGPQTVVNTGQRAQDDFSIMGTVVRNRQRKRLNNENENENLVSWWSEECKTGTTTLTYACTHKLDWKHSVVPCVPIAASSMG